MRVLSLTALVVAAAFICVTAHSQPQTPHYDQGTINLEDIKDVRSMTRLAGEQLINDIRAEAIRETALTYGSQAGLYSQMVVINRILDANERTYDRVFRFEPIMMADNVLPPVIQQGRDNVRLEGRRMRIADTIYDMVSPPRFAEAPPNWRTYLYLQAPKPEPPDETLLPDPEKEVEVKLWQAYVERGWKAGVKQADRSFELQLNRLQRDLSGMALYRQLLAKEMITPPHVTEKFLGVTGKTNRMAINDRVLEIAANPAFIRDNSQWRPTLSRGISGIQGLVYTPQQRDPKVDVVVVGNGSP